MRVLLIGSGGREHALAWKLASSPRLTALYVAPGNAGTDQPQSRPPLSNLSIPAEDSPALVEFAQRREIDLVIIGPEAPLAAGLADALRAVGVRVFGPSQAAAQIESSKAFAKAFMARHAIPTARYAVFTRFDEALDHLRSAGYPVVLKASGLAAGKGVVVPNSDAEAEAALRRIMLAREFGAAGDEVVIEERLEGEEVSLLAFTDGVTVRAMPPAQDHKRLLDGDRGPNTGGMGAYAPAPCAPAALVDEVMRRVLQPAVDGLRAEGRPFVGCLYAGLMLTRAGPRVLEFNCRFGDPETQALLPLLESDLLEVALACAEGRLGALEIRWKPGAAACVVLASEGYPGACPTGRTITGLDAPLTDAVVFHAGTRRVSAGTQRVSAGTQRVSAGTQRVDDKIITAGGRVLAVTGWGAGLPEALRAAYAAVRQVHFDGKQYRRDIGWRAVAAPVERPPTP